MKIYRGQRQRYGTRVTVNGCRLNPRLDLWAHSPTGLEWGYGGSGPAQLALALLADFLRNDDRAVRLHQDFKRSVVAGLSHDGWTLTEEQVRQGVASLSAA